MRSAPILVLLLALLSGCASQPEGPEVARGVVLKHIGDKVGTVGPFNRKDKKELQSLSPQDRSAAITLLDQGALGFLICRPESNDPAPAATGGALADLIKVDRIMFVRGGQIVGDFAAVK